MKALCDIPVGKVALPHFFSVGDATYGTWYDLFDDDPASTGCEQGDLWVWWGRQVGGVRQQIMPVPIG